MDKKIEKILLRFNGKRVGIFVDDANMYHAQKKASWRLDWKAFIQLLKKYTDVKVVNYHVAIPKKTDKNYPSTQKYLKYLGKVATIKSKPLKYIKDGGRIITKGDVDLEIAIDVVRNIKNLDAIFIVAGDSDYLELKNWISDDNKKGVLFIGFENSMAWEIKYCWHLFIDKIRGEVELKK